MIRKLVLIAALFLAFPSWAEVHQREYGVATTIPFKLYDTSTGGLDVDEVDGGTEVTLYCDDGAGSTATNDFVDEGPYYSIALTAAEMQCARVAIEIAATDTNVVFVETIGSASASIDDDGSWYDAIPYNSAWDADIQSEAADALTAYDAVVPADLPTNFADLSITATTGRVDVAAVAGTAQTANDNGADINAILLDTAEIGAAGAGLTEAGGTGDQFTGIGWIAAWDAEVQSEANDALVALGLDHLVGASVTGTDVTDNSIIAYLASSAATADWDTYVNTDDSQQAIRDRGDASWTTGGGGSCTADVGCIADGTAQGVTSTTIQLASAESFNDDDIIGATVLVASATSGAGQARLITDWVSSTDTATVDTWTTTPTGTVNYRVFGTPPGSTTSPAPANVVQISGDATAADNLEAAADGAGYNLGGGSVVAASVTGNVGGSVASVTGAINTAAGTITTLDGLDTAQDSQHSTTQSAISGLNDLSAAAVNAEVDTALADIHLDHLLATDYDPASKPGTSTALLNELVESDAGVSRFTANALEQGPTGGGDSAATIAAAVWADATRTLTALDEDSTTIDLDASNVGGIAGTINTLDALDTAQDTQHSTTQSSIAALNDLDAAGVRTAVGLASANLDTQLTNIDPGVVLEQLAQVDSGILNCEVNTANFAGSTTTLACILTDRDDGAVTQATGDLEGRYIEVLSGAQIREQRFITDTTWDAGNSELQLTLSRALPGTLADGVTAVIR